MCAGSKRENTVGMLLRDNQSAIGQDDETFRPGQSVQDACDRTVAVDPAHGTVVEVAEQEAPLLVENQVIGARTSRQDYVGSIALRRRRCCRGHGGSIYRGRGSWAYRGCRSGCSGGSSNGRRGRLGTG